MVMTRDQNARRSYNMKIDNRSFESGENFKNFGKNLKNQNSIQEEIKSGLNSGNASVIRCRTFRLPVCYKKFKYLDIQNYNSACCFV